MKIFKCIITYLFFPFLIAYLIICMEKIQTVNAKIINLYDDTDKLITEYHYNTTSYYIEILQNTILNSQKINKIVLKNIHSENNISLIELKTIDTIIKEYQSTIYNKNILLVNKFTNKHQEFIYKTNSFYTILNNNIHKLKIYSNSIDLPFEKNIIEYIHISKEIINKINKIRTHNINQQLDFINILQNLEKLSRQERINKFGKKLKEINKYQKSYVIDIDNLQTKLRNNDTKLIQVLYNNMNEMINGGFKPVIKSIFANQKKIEYVYLQNK